jgi:NAD-dependent DNA ligase
MISIKDAKNFSVKKLVALLKKLSDAYYNKKEQLVSDAVYDELLEILKCKDPQNPFLSEIGYEPKGKKNKVPLPFSMGSLEKIKPDHIEELVKWKVKYTGPFVLSDKLDGISGQLYKDKDGIVKLYSRGKKNIGQDISHLLSYMNIRYDKLPKDTSVRGELIINKKDFKKIEDRMENARNAVAGLVNSKTVDKEIAKITQYVCYNVLHPELYQMEQMTLLKDWGFKVVTYKLVNDISEPILKNYLLERRKESEFEIDGIVCFDNSKIHELPDGNPDYGFAFKMILDEQIAIAEVVRIKWEESRDGYLKPTIEIKPVRIGGTTITFATGHNAKFIVDNKLGPGAKIKIIRSGDVIPYVLDVVEQAKEPQMPSEPYKWTITKVDIIQIEESDLVKIKVMEHFFKVMGVKYLAEGIIKKVYDKGYTDVFKFLKANKDDLIAIEGLGNESVNKIFNEINKSFKTVSLSTFMYASHQFGRGLGEKKIKEILKVYPNILTLSMTSTEMKEKIMKIDGFSETLSDLFVKNFDKFKKFYNTMNKIEDINRFISQDKNTKKVKNTKQLFKGMKIVFTGFRDKKLEEFITNNGGNVVSSVSSNTSLVVRSDDEISSSKLEKAKENNIKIMTKTEFIKKYKF